MNAPRNVFSLDAVRNDSERRLRKQFLELASPQGFLEAQRRLERDDRERLLMSGYAKRRPEKPDAA